jgi:hypothetical protein
VAGGHWMAVVGVHHFIGHQEIAAAHEVVALDPQHAQMRRIAAVGNSRQALHFDRRRVLRQVAMGGKDHRPHDVFRMPQLDRLDEGGNLGGSHRQPLALGHRHRAAVGPGGQRTGMPMRSRPVTMAILVMPKRCFTASSRASVASAERVRCGSRL